MNQSLYRIVFNKARGCMMAVSELASSNAKGKDKTQSASGSSSRATQTHTASEEAGTFGFSKPVIKAINSFVLMSLLIPSLTAPLGAYAQVISDPNAPGNERPTILNSANGLPQVNIQTPSAKGVSRNKYSQFDVDGRGIIINNSRTNTQTNQGGLVQGNPWLAQGSARIIVNEVNSSNPSYLNGYIEIAGQRAEIIIANPAGISVNGGGFINASSATLTTGKPIINDGGLEGFSVQKGTISINGYGLDASLTDYTGILARAVEVNAGIWANNLQIVTGANQISADQSTSTPIAGVGGAPAFALDVSNLGGMYAGKITLIGTEAGLGVRNAGYIGASGDLSINSEGILINSGLLSSSANTNLSIKGSVDNSGSISALGNTTIDSKGEIRNSGGISAGGNLGLASGSTITNNGNLSAEGSVNVTSASGINNSGQIYASGNTTLKTGGDILNSGMVAAQGNTTLTSTAVGGNITNTPTSILAAGMTPDGQMLNTGNLSLEADSKVTAQGLLVAGNQLAINSSSLDLSDTNLTTGALSLIAKNGDLNLAGSKVSVARELDLSASQTLATDSAVISAQTLSIDAAKWTNTKGQILQLGSTDTAIKVTGAIDNTGGFIASNGQNLNINAAAIDSRQGNILHAGSGQMTVATGKLGLAKGQIASNGDLNLTASQIDGAQGALVSKGSMLVNVAGDVNLSNGQVGAGKELKFSAASLNISGGQLTSQEKLELYASGALDNNNGLIASSSDVTLRTDAIGNNGGTIAGKSLDINTNSQVLSSIAGTIASSGTLTINSGALNNDKGSIQSAGNMVVNTNGQTLTNTGGDAATGKGILSQGTLTINTGDVDNSAGYLAAVGKTTIDAKNVSNAAIGTVVSGDALSIKATDDFNNATGQIQAAKNLDITTQGSLDSTKGLIVSGTQLDLNIGKTLTTDSGVVSATTLGITATYWSNVKGQVIQTGNTDTVITVSGALNNTEGYIASNGQNLTIQSASLNSNLGNILHANSGKLTITTGKLDLANGQIASNGDMALAASQIDGNKGAIVSKGLLQLDVAGAADLSGGQIGAGKDLTVTAGSLNVSDGQVTSQTNLKLTVTGAVDTSKALVAANNDVILKTGALNNKEGKIAGNAVEINTSTQSLDNSAGTIASSTTLSISSGALINDAGSIQSAGNMVVDANNHALTNTGGNTITGKGILSQGMLTLNSGALDNNGGYIAASDKVVLTASSLTNNAVGTGSTAVKGAIISNDELKITTTVGDLTNVGGQIQSAKKLSLDVKSVLDNTQGLIATSATIDIKAGSIVNKNTKTETITDKLDANNQPVIDLATGNIVKDTKLDIKGIQAKTVTITAGNIDNTEGGILASEMFTIVGSGSLNNTKGMLAAGDIANIKATSLNNTEGVIQSTKTLTIEAGTGVLDNTKGLIASSADVDIKSGSLVNKNTKVESLVNKLDSVTGLVVKDTAGNPVKETKLDIKGIQAKNVTLSTGSIDNTDGGILASQDLTILGTGVLNNTKGMLAASETATIVATGVNNTQGTIQSAQALTLDVGAGTLTNSQGLVASSTTVAIQADTINNQNTKENTSNGVVIKGIQGKSVTLNANHVNNTNGGILAVDSLLIQGAGVVNNTNGMLSSTGTVTIKDTLASPTTNADGKTQQIINTGGAIVANKQLTIDSKSLTGDGAILNAGVTANGVTTEGDISIKLLDSFAQTSAGSIQANGNLDMQTKGDVTNAGLIQSRQVLTLQAANINNQLGGEISAGATQLAANGSITNRGLIDGSFTLLQANEITNIGTGRIYGNQLSILAGSLSNLNEAGKAAVIAARERLDIGAYVVTNQDGALLLSLGDMAVGNTLDANGKATGQAEAFINSSATVEVMGNLNVSAKSLNNVDGHGTSGSNTVTEQIVEYLILDADHPLNANGPVFLNAKDGWWDRRTNEDSQTYAIFNANDGSMHGAKTWAIFTYTRTINTTGSFGTDPATISVGGSMTTNFVDGVNDKSKIVVGGALTGNGESFQNIGNYGTSNQHDEGTVIHSYTERGWYDFQRQDRRFETDPAPYTPTDINNNWQSQSEIAYNTVPTINGTVGARSDVVVAAAQPAVATPNTITGQAPVTAAGTAGTGTVGTNNAVAGGSTVNGVATATSGASTATVGTNNAVAGGSTISGVATATSGASTGTVGTNNGVSKANAPSAVGKVVRSSNSTTAQLPNNSLYIIQPTSGNHSPKGYLVETDPRFTQNKLWLGSDYMLKQMGYDPATQTQRLGDGFYEQKLIREQIAQLTGRRFLDDNNGEQYANDEAQYQALMNAGVQFARDYGLIPGVALTAEQMARLTTDIVWLVSKTVTLPDGSTTQVLVPQVYALVKPGDIDGSGNLLSAKSIDLKLKGDMVNSGLMAARGNLSIDAANIANLTGTLKGLDVSLLASQDIQSIQGNIMAGNTLKVGAGNDVVIKAGNVASGGNASITAGNDLLILAQEKGRQVSINWGARDAKGNLIDPNNKDNSLSFGTYDQTGTNLNVGGSLSLSAGNDFYSQGAQVSAGAGISVHAGSKALSVTAKHGSFYESSQVNKQKTWFGLGSITTTDTVNKTDVTNTMSNWNGGAGGVSFTASGVATTVGTNMAGNGGINIKGGKETNTLAAYDEHTNNSSHSVKSNDFGRFMDTLANNWASTYTLDFSNKNTDSADIKTNSTRTALRPTLDGGAGGVSVTTNEGGTVNIEAPIIKGASYTIGGGAQTNYIAAIDSRDVSHTTTARNFLWQSESSTGSKTEVMHLANIQVPANNINFIGTGGISVQIPKGSNLAVQINTLAKQPGNEYLGELAKRSDIDWKQVELVNKTWDYKKSGLTQEATIIVAIVVTIFTAGAASSAGASLAASAGLTTTTAAGATVLTAGGAALAGATSAAITTLASSAAIAILNNQGDVAAALKEMGSKENVKNLVVAMATAGLVQGIGVEFGLDKINASSKFIDQLGANMVNGVAGSVVSTAVYGGSLEDNLKKSIISALINTAGAQAAFGIGTLTNDNQTLQTTAEKFANKFAHAVLGCAMGAATADSQASCGAGALGAVAGSLGAELFDPTNSSDPIKKAQAQQFAKLTAAIAVAATGGDAQLMTIGGMTAVNAVANNRQLHQSEAQKLAALKVGKSAEEQRRLDAAACALVNCANGIPESDPNYSKLQKLQSDGQVYKNEQKALLATGEFIYEPIWDTARDAITRKNELVTRAVGAGNLAAGSLGVVGGGLMVVGGIPACPTTGIGCAAVPLGIGIAALSNQQAQDGSKALLGSYVSTEGQRVIDSFNPLTYPGERDPLLNLGLETAKLGLIVGAAKVIPKGLAAAEDAVASIGKGVNGQSAANAWAKGTYTGESAITYEGTVYRYTDPKYANTTWEIHPRNVDENFRFSEPGIGSIYAGTEANTARAEVASYSALNGKVLVSGDVKIDKVLDLTNPDALKALGVTKEQITASSHGANGTYKETQKIAEWAREQGYGGILAPSAQNISGTNLITFGSYAPRTPTGVKVITPIK